MIVRSAFAIQLLVLCTLAPAPARAGSGGDGVLASDTVERIGDIQIVSNIEAPDTWKIYEAWYQQTLFTGRLAVQPDVQYVIDPRTDPGLENALVVAGRFELSH